MLNAKNEGLVYGVLSCIFAVILVLYVAIFRNLIDIIYLMMISIFILKYFIEIKKK